MNYELLSQALCMCVCARARVCCSLLWASALCVLTQPPSQSVPISSHKAGKLSFSLSLQADLQLVSASIPAGRSVFRAKGGCTSSNSSSQSIISYRLHCSTAGPQLPTSEGESSTAGPQLPTAEGESFWMAVTQRHVRRVAVQTALRRRTPPLRTSQRRLVDAARSFAADGEMSQHDEQPWQERLVLFVMLCGMVVYLARVVLNFRSGGLTLVRDSCTSSSEQELTEGAEEHSD